MDSYKVELIKYLKNTEGHLMAEWTKDTTPLSELNAIAEESLERKNPEGYIAALFIYHQLTFEILRDLLIRSNFLIKLALYPIHYTPKKYSTESKFSELLMDLEHSINFKGKTKIISQARLINKLRNDFGHRIIENYSYSDIDQKLANIKIIHDGIFQTWGSCLRDIGHLTKQAKKRTTILKLIND
jgi:hypothetical protein